LKWLWIALAALAVIAAIVCVLVFVVFDGDGGGGPAEGTPEEVVSRLLTAMENGDIDAIFGLMDPQMLEETIGEEFLDMAKAALEQEMLAGGTIRFSDLEMQVDETSETTATVTIVEGTVTITDSDGTEMSEDVTDSAEPVEFHLIKRDGSWYLEPSSMGW
jgi:hypothetical protein